jgi:hypothetical protein
VFQIIPQSENSKIPFRSRHSKDVQATTGRLKIMNKPSNIYYGVAEATFTANSHYHAVPLPRRTAKGLDCAFPI